jgi:transposase
MATARWDDEEADEALRERAIELRLAGHTQDEIRRELHIGSDRVKHWLQGVPSPARRTYRPIRDRYREAAVRLRLQGKSYREIAAEIPVSKSTLSGWLCDVPLTQEHRERIEGLREGATLSRAASIRARRIRRTAAIMSAAAAEIGELSERELFIAGVVAYWAEGTKAKPWSPSAGSTFINSDPEMIRFFLRWLRCVRVPDDEITFRLAIHETADVPAALAFWSEVVGVDASAFLRTTIKRHRPQSRRHNVNEHYHGCLVVRVLRSTELNRRIAGWWSGIAR